MPKQDPFGYDEAHEAAAFIQKQIQAAGFTLPKLSLTLGSGLKSYADRYTQENKRLVIPYKDIPYFARPKQHALGHAGELIIAPLESDPNKSIAIWSGRLHFYQDLSFSNGERILHPADHKAAVVFYLAINRALGVKTILTSNAVGSVQPQKHRVGELVAITDHILNPNEDFALPVDERWFAFKKSARPNYNFWGEDYFYGQGNLYSPQLRQLMQEVAEKRKLTLHEGVLFWNRGRGYESPAMSKDIQIRGGDMAGMSTAPEAQKARSLGYDNEAGGRHFASISLVTNVAVLRHEDKLIHDHVAEEGQAAEDHVSPFMHELIEAIHANEPA